MKSKYVKKFRITAISTFRNSRMIDSKNGKNDRKESCIIVPKLSNEPENLLYTFETVKSAATPYKMAKTGNSG